MDRGLQVTAQTDGAATVVWRVSLWHLLLLLFVLLFFGPELSLAARKRVIFQLANLNQWVELKYDYFGTTSDDAYSSTSHDFEERYHLDIDYAVLSRRFVKGGLGVSLGLTQEIESNEGLSFKKNDQTDGHSLEYDVDMQVFERSIVPVYLSANQSQRRISSPFSSPYDQINQSYSAGVQIRSDFLPVSFRYREINLSIEGKTQNRQRENKSLTLLAVFEQKYFGEIDMTAELYDNYTFSKGREPDTLERNSLEVNHRYDLKLFAQRQHLASRYKKKQETGTSQIDSETWTEDLSVKFGKALDGDAYFYWNKIESPIQVALRKQLRGALNHELYKSLKTSLKYELKNNKYTDGENDFSRYAATIDYRKKLPGASKLQLGYGYSVANSMQRSSNNEELIVDEGMTVDLIGNTLSHENVLETTITLFNFDRTIMFEEGTDYEVLVSANGQVSFQFFSLHLSGAIQLGDQISIDYAHRVNSFIEYQTVSHNFSTSLSLLSQTLLIYSDFSLSDPELIAGTADTAPLERTRQIGFGVESVLGEHEFGLRYLNLDSAYSQEESYNVYWRYSSEYRGGHLNLRLENTYRVYSATLLDTQYQNQDEVITNAVSFRADYRRRLNKFIQMELDNYIYDIRGDYGDQTDVSLGIKFEAVLNKIRASLEGELSFQIDEHQTRRNESIRLNVRRSF
jgi:hypothetical protein